jgi:hypothetical protein
MDFGEALGASFLSVSCFLHLLQSPFYPACNFYQADWLALFRLPVDVIGVGYVQPQLVGIGDQRQEFAYCS